VWRRVDQVVSLQSSDPGAFFNHLLAEPRAGIVVLANAKRKAVYTLQLSGASGLELCWCMVRRVAPSDDLDATDIGSIVTSQLVALAS